MAAGDRGQTALETDLFNTTKAVVSSVIEVSSGRRGCKAFNVVNRRLQSI
jgi:hypothetical protein